MSAPSLLRPADLRLIVLVAARRRDQTPPGLDEAAVTSMLGRLSEADGPQPSGPFRRAASLVRGLMDLLDGPLGRQVALLGLCCQLRLEGYQLTAPQGVLAGMIEATGRGRLDATELARWIEDRALLMGGH